MAGLVGVPWRRTTSGKDVFQLVDGIQKALEEANFAAVLRLSNLALNINTVDPNIPPSERSRLHRWRAEARLALEEGVTEALGDAEEAVRLDSTAKAYSLLGQAHRALGNVEEARRAEDRAKQLDSRDQLRAMLQAVDEMFAQGKTLNAYSMATNGSRLSVRSHCPELLPDFQRRILLALVGLGRFPEAIKQGQQALEDARKREDKDSIRVFEEIVAKAQRAEASPPTPPAPSLSTPEAVVALPSERVQQGQVLGSAEQPKKQEQEQLRSSPLVSPDLDSAEEPQEDPDRLGLDEKASAPEHPHGDRPRAFGRSLSGSGNGVPTLVIIAIAVVATGSLLAAGIFYLFMICRTHREEETSFGRCMYNHLKEVKDLIELFSVPLQLWTVILTGVITAVSWLRFRGPG